MSQSSELPKNIKYKKVKKYTNKRDPYKPYLNANR